MRRRERRAEESRGGRGGEKNGVAVEAAAAGGGGGGGYTLNALSVTQSEALPLTRMFCVCEDIPLRLSHEIVLLSSLLPHLPPEHVCTCCPPQSPLRSHHSPRPFPNFLLFSSLSSLLLYLIASSPCHSSSLLPLRLSPLTCSPRST
eukprot:767794-Hanusia_phi.AAC.3